MLLKCNFIIGEFAPMNQNTMSLIYFVLNFVARVKYVVANVCNSYLNDVVGWNENIIYSRINIQYMYVNDHLLEKTIVNKNFDSGPGSICSHHRIKHFQNVKKS
jgi:hypothetical protein